jgi:hypothetical protein
MTRHIGAILGAAHAATSGAAGSLIDPYFCNGRVARIARDYWTADGVENDTVVLGNFDWTTRFDALSVIEFSDFGTGISLDVGVEVGPSSGAADPDCLVDGQDIATAAGSASLLKSVTIANRHKTLWELAGFASAAAARTATVANGGRATVIATLLGGNPDSGTLSWTFYGSPQ